MECIQHNYFFIILDKDSCGILTEIPSERIIIGNCKTAKVKSDHYLIPLLPV